MATKKLSTEGFICPFLIPLHSLFPSFLPYYSVSPQCFFPYFFLSLFLYWSFFLSIFLSFHLSLYLFVFRSICLSIVLSISLSFYHPLCLSFSLLFLSFPLSLYLSLCRIHPSFHLSLCLSPYFFSINLHLSFLLSGPSGSVIFRKSQIVWYKQEKNTLKQEWIFGYIHDFTFPHFTVLYLIHNTAKRIAISSAPRNITPPPCFTVGSNVFLSLENVLFHRLGYTKTNTLPGYWRVY